MRRHAWNLDIHLKRCNSVARAGNFKVHIAVVIFSARDISQNSICIAFFHESHGHTGNRRFDGNSGIHECERSTAYGRHRG